MKVALNWLKKYINIDLSVTELSELLTDTGLEIEGVNKIESIPGGLEGIVIGEVLTCTQHPNADKLKITTVDIGEEDVVQIVCGAANVASGQKVVVAKVNSTLYADPEKPFKIKKAKIRGEHSYGMICAEDEIGLGNSHDGIMVLDTKLPNGTPASKFFDIENDTVFEIGLTPNRADAMGHIGVARDVKAVTGKEILWPSVDDFAVNNTELPIAIKIENQEACPRYSGLSISGVKIADSPNWLQNALRSIGIEPINNVVDITNFVMHELGQPLHAFDAERITGQEIRVKNLPEGTPFQTLDEKERKLKATDLMICDGSDQPLCIAGVFGGLHSGVKEHTTQIFLESAYFSADSIRKSAQVHTLKTDASFRYERGTDPNITVYALKRAALLIKEIAGGEIASNIADHGKTAFEDRSVEMKYKNIHRLIGKSLSEEEIGTILTRLDIKQENSSEKGFTAMVPPYRVDVTREADVIEEIIRIHGLNNIELPESLSTNYFASFPKVYPHTYRMEASKLLAATGYQEILTNSLTKSIYSEKLSGFEPSDNVEILNKLSEDLGVMRQHLLFTGLEILTYNINRKQTNLKFFEFGKVYKKIDSEYKESNRLALYMSGLNQNENWIQKSEKAKFHDLYSAVLKIFNKFSAETIENEEFHDDIFDYGLKLKLKGKVVAEIGKLSLKVRKLAAVKQDVFFANVDWDEFLHNVNTEVSFEEVSKFPEVKRDLSLVIDKSTSYDEIKELTLKTAGNIISKIEVFDVYEGDKIDEGKKAYALSYTLQDKQKTLTDKIIDKTMNRLMRAYETEIKAHIRK